MKNIFLFTSLFLVACASNPKCDGPLAVYEEKSCVPRIRQVAVGSDLLIPESLKADWQSHELVWIEPIFKDGQIVLGHFALVPRSGK